MRFAECRRRRTAPLVIAASFLSACGAATPEPPEIVAPEVRRWSPETQAEIAGELEACGDCDAIERALIDCVGLRDASRAITP